MTLRVCVSEVLSPPGPSDSGVPALIRIINRVYSESHITSDLRSDQLFDQTGLFLFLLEVMRSRLEEIKASL